MHFPDKKPGTLQAEIHREMVEWQNFNNGFADLGSPHWLELRSEQDWTVWV